MLNRAKGISGLTLQEFFIDYGQQNRQPGEFVEAVILAAIASRSKIICL